MKKSLITILITSVCFIQCYSPSGIIKDDFYTNCGFRIDVNNNSDKIENDRKSPLLNMRMKSKIMHSQNNYYLQDRIRTNNSYNQYGYYKKGKESLDVCLKTEQEYLEMQNEHLFREIHITKGFKYLFGGLIIIGVVDGIFGN